MQKIVKAPENQSFKQANYESALEELYANATQLRRAEKSEIEKIAEQAYEEDATLAIKLFFHMGDVRGGKGEKEVFEACMDSLIENHPEVAMDVLWLIPVYAKWDEVIRLTVADQAEIADEAIRLVVEQFQEDMQALEDLKGGKAAEISPLTKRMTAIMAKDNGETAKLRRVMTTLQISEKDFRQTVTELSSRVKVNEMRETFSPYLRKLLLKKRHDFVQATLSGDVDVKAAFQNPVEICHDYAKGNWQGQFETNDDYEALWNLIPKREGHKGKTLAVWDGSNSMTRLCGQGTAVNMLEVATATSIFCAQGMSGAYQNVCIPFSNQPRLINLTEKKSLADCMITLEDYNECANLDLEATFDLILDDAVSRSIKVEDVPEWILIMSDVEIDQARGVLLDVEDAKPTGAVIEKINAKWNQAGYQTPTIVYWNLSGKRKTDSNAEPLKHVITIDGYSEEKLAAVMAEEYDKLEGILENEKTVKEEKDSIREQMLAKLSRERYDSVEETAALALRP